MIPVGRHYEAAPVEGAYVARLLKILVVTVLSFGAAFKEVVAVVDHQVQAAAVVEVIGGFGVEVGECVT